MSRRFRSSLLPSVLIAILTAISMQSAAQCETHFDEEEARRFDRLIQSNPQRGLRFDYIDVPVAFHIGTVNGNPVYNANNLPGVIDQCNLWYEAGNFGISQCGPVFYYAQGTNPIPINNVINVYITTTYNGCGVYYGSISINPTCSLPMDEILAHEVGHALGLPHTHGFSNYGTTDELANGSNCTTAGDRFCDTPADPNLLGLVNGACAYVGNLVDANGESYNPDTGNIMSYTNGNCRDNFSPEQLTRMYEVASALAFTCCLTPVPLAQNLSTCLGTDITIEIDVAADTVLWYTQPDGGEPFFEGASYTTPLLSSSKTWYVEALDSCPSERARIFVDVLPGVSALREIPSQLSDFYTFGEQQGGIGGGDSIPGAWISQLVSDEFRDYIFAGQREAWVFNGDSLFRVAQFDLAGGTSVSSVAAGNGFAIIGLNDWNGMRALYISDGSEAGTEEIYSWPGNDYSYSNFWLTPFQGSFVFALSRSDGGAEIWISDGSNAGTSMLVHLPFTSGYAAFNFQWFGDHIYFSAAGESGNTELWRSNGTPEGTGLYLDLNPSAGSSAAPEAVMGEHLYFTANDGLNGSELWKTNGDGTATMVADIHPTGSSSIYNVQVTGNLLVFPATDGVNGTEPWASDGTPEGTFMMSNVNVTGFSSPDGFCNCNGRMYFGARRTNGNHPALYAFDPVSLEIALIKSFDQPGYSGISETHCHNGLLYFNAAQSGNNFEVWVSDGSTDGTRLAAEINPSAVNGSNPSSFFSRNGKLYFSANNGLTGNQLWTFTEPEYLVCYGDDVLLRAGNTAGVINWYSDEAGNDWLHSGYDFLLENLAAPVSVWAAYEDGGCESGLTRFDVGVRAIESLAFESLVCTGEESDLLVHALLETDSMQYVLDMGMPQDSAYFTGLQPGQYTLQVSWGMNCTQDTVINIGLSPEILVDTEISQNISCHGGIDGSIVASASGGTGSLLFSANGEEFGEASVWEGLSAGSYSIVTRDSLGCISVPSLILLGEPEVLSAYADIVQPECGNECGGSVALSISGGTVIGSYQLYWERNGEDLPDPQPGMLAADLCEGEYSALIRDDNGCELLLNELQLLPVEYLWYYPDGDGDGYGSLDGGIEDCVLPPFYSALSGDCDDQNNLVFPGAPGTGNGWDNNCDGSIDPSENACPGDLNNDNIVNTNDLLAFLGGYGCLLECTGDVDGDGDTDTSDLLVLLANYGTVCD